MSLVLPVFIVSLFCSWFECESGPEPPYLYLSMNNERKFLSALSGYSEREIEGIPNYVRGPIVSTKLGPVEGYTIRNNEGRKIYMFTGLPYGEPPIGHFRFRDPVPKKPWRGIFQATKPSPFCIQASAATSGMFRGQEDCLYLDVHTPRVPYFIKDFRKEILLPASGEVNRTGLPVIMWIPAGAHMYGRSLTYGSANLLREDVIYVPINTRYGALGFLSTGDAASPGNWGLKDQALAVKWVHDHIEAFGGDPNRIIIGGISSGSESAHSMLFTKHEARSYIKGIIGMSGSCFAEHGLDTKGRVREASDIVAKEAGCPTSRDGNSWEMVECLRKVNPYMLAVHQLTPLLWELPHMSKMWGPTIEPDSPNAYITELPETLYERGEVPPIPLILTRTEDETGIFSHTMRLSLLQVVRLNWFDWMPKFMRLTYRNTKLGEEVTKEQAQTSLRKVMQYYFGKETPPRFLNQKEFLQYNDMINDAFYNVPMWKALEMHNEIAPAYSYISKLNTMNLNPHARLYNRFNNDNFGASHATDYVLLFNNSRGVPTLQPGTEVDIASKNLINLVANFAAYGKPLYRTPTGQLLPLWTTIGDVNNMKVLEIGLVHNISMVLDPLPSTMRMKIWEQVKF